MAGDSRIVTLLVAIGILMLLTAGVALFGVVGVFGTDGSAGTTPTPTATDGPATASSTESPFTLDTRPAGDCGMLCQSVTVTVTNEQATVAREVTVATQLYAGNDTDGEVRWADTERVGRLGPGENYTATRQVELDPDAAYAVQAAEWWVTTRTTVESADTNHTVINRRQVS